MDNSNTKGTICPQCGERSPKNAAFCLKCGARLIPEKTICPRCGERIPRGRLCLHCGYMLAEPCPFCGAELLGKENSARNAEELCAVGEASNPKRFLIKMTLSHKGERREKEGKDKTEKALVCLGLLRIPT